ncbi:MAG: hypothetical protein RLZZ387_1178 [Chloroflexota bacterium]|jgi:hypothetical protein
MGNNYFGNDPSSRETRRDESSRARRAALSAIMVLFLILLILLLIAAATDRTDILRLTEGFVPTTLGLSLFTPVIAAAAEKDDELVIASVPPTTVALAVPAPSGDVSQRIRAYYDRCGGERVFGRPISPLIAGPAVTYQWFERARLEFNPQLAGTPYEVQGARLGAETLAARPTPPAPSGPGATGRLFPQTGYSVAGPILTFWEQNGAVDVLGYPISPELQETLADGQAHTVQYFERARLEIHPQLAGTPYEVQIGLLGRELYRP